MTNERDQILFISSYPPRECGIATFTQDVVHAFNRMFDQTFDVKVCALQEDDKIERIYPEEVIAHWNTESIEQSTTIAHMINTNEQMSSVVIEHEFGLFKGEFGENIFHLLDKIHKPVFICMHTVLQKPPKRLYEVVSRLVAKAEKLIVLTQHSKDVLKSDYHVPSSQVMVIPHGVHSVKPLIDRASLKTKYGFGDKLILGTFGLISSNKGIETALESIAALPKEQREKILYLVMGKTHPVIYKNEGEKYREFLIDKTHKLGIEKQVLFINKYLELNELLTYLKLTDIYLFTSKDPNQTVSGTLSYAMGAGCTVVSTPIPHAKEMLTDNAGYIFNFGDCDELKNIILRLIESPQQLRATSVNAARKARANTWENVANQYAKLLKKHLNQDPLQYSFPPLQLQHFCDLTNKQGMVQFCNMSDPDMESGYTTDDNARALYVLTLYNELHPNDPWVKNYFNIYLNFLRKAFQPNGRFLNYMDKNGRFTKQNYSENLEEANARAFLALCRFVQSPNVPFDLKMAVRNMILQCSKYIYSMRSPRSMAKVIKGLYFLDQHKKDATHSVYIHTLSHELLRLYDEVAVLGWEWFEPYLTYNNSSIPEGLMYAYLATNEAKYKKIAIRAFEFLLSKNFSEGRIKVISNNGWSKKGESYTHSYGEQPMEIASMMEALYIFYQATGDLHFKDHMSVAFSWFLGNNHLSQMIYNPTNGGCHDGIEEFEVNINQGAESTLSYIISKLTMDKLKQDEQFLSEIFTFSNNKSMQR